MMLKNKELTSNFLNQFWLPNQSKPKPKNSCKIGYNQWCKLSHCGYYSFLYIIEKTVSFHSPGTFRENQALKSKNKSKAFGRFGHCHLFD